MLRLRASKTFNIWRIRILQQVGPKFLCSPDYGIQTMKRRGNKVIVDKSWNLWTFLEAEKRLCDVGFAFEKNFRLSYFDEKFQMQ
jgi:hypothetical protein